MKKLPFIIAILISFNSYSQNIYKRAGDYGADTCLETGFTRKAGILSAPNKTAKFVQLVDARGVEMKITVDSFPAGGGSTSISSLTAPTGTNSINNADYTQTWNWSTLTNGVGLYLTSLASTTGTTGGSVLTVLRSGSLSNASQTTYGAIIQNQHTGTTETNVGLKVEATGATNNYAIIVPASSGNVGIGTATPAYKLHVVGDARIGETDGMIEIQSGIVQIGDVLGADIGSVLVVADDAYFDNTAHAMNVGINTTTPSVALEVWGDALIFNAASGLSVIASTSKTTIGDIAGSGNGITVEVDDANQKTTISGGTVTFAGYGAGAATFDASGNISSVSDIRLKNVQGGYNVGLSALMKIKPIVYKWNGKSKMETEHSYIGFSAQNINAALGDNATGVNKDGYLSIQDRAIMATMVVAIQEQQKMIEELQKEIKKLKRK